MPDYQPLNSKDHPNLRIITDRGARYGDDVHSAMVFPFEFRRVQACYPIFFQEDAVTGKLYPLALFGFEEGKNLFLDEDGWNAEYIPLMVQHHPFFIGFREDETEPDGRTPIVSIDMGSPRVSEDEGEALFLPDGSASDYLTRMTRILEDVQFGQQTNMAFIDALLELELIESIAMEIQLVDGSKRKLVGLHSIDEDKLEALDGDALGKLHNERYLLPVYMILASLGRFRTLIDKVNERLMTGSPTALNTGGR